MSERTFSEVRKLQPGDGYVVHSAAMRKYVTEMIRDRISPDLAKTVRIFVVAGRADIERMHGWRGRILIDHVVQQRIQWAAFQHLLVHVQGVNARHERVAL